MYIEERLKAAALVKAKILKRNKNKPNVMPEKGNTTSVQRIQIHASTMASEPARARLLWAISFLVLPVTFGHTTSCRSLALIFSVTIYFAMKRSTPCSDILRHSPSSWAAVVHWSAFYTESTEVVQETPHQLLFLAPDVARAPHQLSAHQVLRQSRNLNARHKSRQKDSSRAYNRLDALTSRLDKRVQIGNRVVGTIVLSPTNAASQEAVVGST